MKQCTSCDRLDAAAMTAILLFLIIISSANAAAISDSIHTEQANHLPPSITPITSPPLFGPPFFNPPPSTSLSAHGIGGKGIDGDTDAFVTVTPAAVERDKAATAMTAKTPPAASVSEAR
jgi:hypothetical protein